MALILFNTMWECLQSPHSLPGGILSEQEGPHYGDVHYMSMHHMLLMQCIPYQHFNNLVQDHAFQPVKAVLKDASDTTTILLVFVSDDQLTSIVHVYIRLVVHHISSQIYEPRAIPQFIQYIKADLKHTKEKQEAGSSTLRVQSYCMFVVNFGGIMALPTNLPYCLVYPNIYSSTVPEKDRHHFNIEGWPSWGAHLHLHLLHPASACRHIHRLQVATLWESPSDSPCNHRVPLVDLSTGEPFPLVPVGDFQFEDNIFPWSFER